MSVFEAGMLLCFGLSWPFSIAKSVRTRVVSGKSPLFLSFVLIGYLCGITHKWLYNRDGVLALYVLNALMVAADLALYVHLSKPAARRIG